jgi:DNA-binding SARP family transcriptional activator
MSGAVRTQTLDTNPGDGEQGFLRRPQLRGYRVAGFRRHHLKRRSRSAVGTQNLIEMQAHFGQNEGIRVLRRRRRSIRTSESVVDSLGMIRILGPLIVERGGESRALGGPRQRLVLAMLLASPNRPVTFDALIDGLWGDYPPSAPRASLHSYISNLRRVLGHDRIERTPGGYDIHLERTELDALCFEHYVTLALDSPDPARKVELLDQGLALWNGPAFGDLQYAEPLRAECIRLDELRIRAEEERFEALLALGAHHRVLPDLQVAVTRHPQRERLRGQLMLGLYQAGRQIEALETFRDYRLVLSDEMGLDPGDDLWLLEEQILNHDPELTLAERTPGLPGRFAGPHRTTKRVAHWSTAILLSLLLTGSLGGTCEPVPAGTTHRWTAERSAFDALDGTAAVLVGDAAYGSGVLGDGFLLDGDGDYVDTRVVDLGPGTEDLTIALWARFDSTEGEQVLAEKWVQRFGRSSSGWTFTKLDDNSLGFFSEAPGGPPQSIASAPLDIPVDTWVHLAARRLQDRMEILVDGAVVAHHPHDSVIDLASPASIKLGHRGGIDDTPGSEDTRGYYLDGALDEVLISTGRGFRLEDVSRLIDGAAAGRLCPPTL